MKLVLISPEGDRDDELTLVERMFAAGLERYHVRKPQASAGALAQWLGRLSPEWRTRIVVHQHHELVDQLGLGGRHWRDVGVRIPGAVTPARVGAPPAFTSRSCHDLATLRASLAAFDSVFFGPVFRSISKPDHGPRDAQVGEALGAVLTTRSLEERRTTVIALGGISPETAPRALALGFDGVAALGAVWLAADPLAAFHAMRDVCRRVALVAAARTGQRYRSAASRISGPRC